MAPTAAAVASEPGTVACRRRQGIGVEETDRIFVNCAGGVLSSVGKAHDTEIGNWARPRIGFSENYNLKLGTPSIPKIIDILDKV